MGKTRILVIGALGQIGTELVEKLRAMHGEDNVIASDVRNAQYEGIFEQLDVMNKDQIYTLVKKYDITEVYLLAAMLSAKAEENPDMGWKLNMNSLLNMLHLAKEDWIKKLYWPSSIAVFGPTTPLTHTPQHTVADPNTVYGISKLAGERWCEYFHKRYRVDVRSLRYPGLISYKSPPGGGTTDYAINIFYSAAKGDIYPCFLKENATLPMMYMEDAVRATIEIMEADPDEVKVRSAYNLAAISFSPGELTKEIQKFYPEFDSLYQPDFRQQIAESWPQSIDDSVAREDWNWKHEFDLTRICEEMIENIT
ncbi:MAG: NAD-dependent epimerase/dehydratase family protein [Flavobacteriales bacterium]|nr:NAD-dependent epimerase/dehydratase family protein [Flavobacteriales bacterium]